MSNVLPFINMESDKWVIPSSEDLADYTFYFDFIPKGWLRSNVKRYTKECLVIGKDSISTLHRYNYSLRHFFDYLKEYEIELKTFADLTHNMIEQFVFYLLLEVEAPATRAVILASLKHLLRHGQILQWDGFPIKELFDGTEYRHLRTEDVLKSKTIPDPVMNQIDDALKMMEEIADPIHVLLRCLITLVRHTGLRLAEALATREDSLHKDLMGKYILEVSSEKNRTERYIPVSREVVKAIQIMIDKTIELRLKAKTDRIFIYEGLIGADKGKVRHLKQVHARAWLQRYFVKPFNIINPENQNLFRLTYHQFRHTLGTDMLNNGMSLYDIQNYLGHESMHSTRLYAKVRNDRLSQEYKKIGFIGVITDKVEKILDSEGKKLNQTQRLMAVLPDGVCARPIKDKVNKCKLPNACLFCKKFITTPDFIDIHREHLQRIKEDKIRYMSENLVGSDYLLEKTERTLEEIISQLERLEESRIG